MTNKQTVNQEKKCELIVFLEKYLYGISFMDKNPNQNDWRRHNMASVFVSLYIIDIGVVCGGPKRQ